MSYMAERCLKLYCLNPHAPQPLHIQMICEIVDYPAEKKSHAENLEGHENAAVCTIGVTVVPHRKYSSSSLSVEQ
jgi:hypothetical protein